jgi:ankyrin repeat protein
MLTAAGCDINAQDDEGATALMLAVSSPRDMENVTALLKLGATTRPRDKHGLTALEQKPGPRFEKVKKLFKKKLP